ncbi:MAG: lysine--tRNA ligase [Candidatus Micrarchaeia archaeon]
MDSDPKKMHWSEIIAKKVIDGRKPPYTVMSGITTSGPLHPGTLCEFLFADAIYKSLEKMAGNAKFVFVADITDAFDNVPGPFKEHSRELEHHLGKPLSDTPDPLGCHSSFADHFFSEATDAMEKFDVHPEVMRADEAYASGKYDEYAIQFSERRDEIKKIVQESSLRESMPDDWHPIMPICEKCGKVATTRVISYESGEYDYVCDGQTPYGAEGCGYKGRARILDHKYKLLWRLDWPARQDFCRVSVEGGSVDHHTKGGSVSTLIAIHTNFFKKEPPIMYKFGFLKYHGKKYSKSKGIGHSVHELMDILPIPVLEYALLRPDIQEDKELVLNEKTLLSLVSDFEHASSLDPDSDLARADRKKTVSYSFTEGRNWSAPLSELLVAYAIYKDWNKAGEVLGDAQGARYLSGYAEAWLKRGWIPEKYVFDFSEGTKPSRPEIVREFAGGLEEGASAEELQSYVFSFAKEKSIQPRELFQNIYTALIGKPRGPRLGKFLFAIGVPRARKMLLKVSE